MKQLKGGYGYYETGEYPIGGSFKRAPKGGKAIDTILRTFPRFKGVTTEVRFSDGTTGALNDQHMEDMSMAEEEGR